MRFHTSCQTLPTRACRELPAAAVRRAERLCRRTARAWFNGRKEVGDASRNDSSKFVRFVSATGANLHPVVVMVHRVGRVFVAVDLGPPVTGVGGGRALVTRIVWTNGCTKTAALTTEHTRRLPSSCTNVMPVAITVRHRGAGCWQLPLEQ